jgi:hypothetical protein
LNGLERERGHQIIEQVGPDGWLGRARIPTDTKQMEAIPSGIWVATVQQQAPCHRHRNQQPRARQPIAVGLRSTY